MFKQVSFFYIDAEQTIHEVTGRVFRNKLWFRRDRSLFSIQILAPLIYGFGHANETPGPVDEHGKPIIQ